MVGCIGRKACRAHDSGAKNRKRRKEANQETSPAQQSHQSGLHTHLYAGSVTLCLFHHNMNFQCHTAIW